MKLIHSDKSWISTEEACAILGKREGEPMSRKTFYNIRSEYKLLCKKEGGRSSYVLSEIMRMKEKRTQIRRAG